MTCRRAAPPATTSRSGVMTAPTRPSMTCCAGTRGQHRPPPGNPGQGPPRRRPARPPGRTVLPCPRRRRQRVRSGRHPARQHPGPPLVDPGRTRRHRADRVPGRPRHAAPGHPGLRPATRAGHAGLATPAPTALDQGCAGTGVVLDLAGRNEARAAREVPLRIPREYDSA